MKFTDIQNNEIDVECLGCAINNGEYAPPFGLVYKNKNFAANSDCEVPIPGFIIVSTRRHIQSIDEFTEEEQKEFILLVSKIRKGMRSALNIDRVTMIIPEVPSRKDDHFHLWLYPVTPESEEMFGFGIKAIKPMMLYAKENMKTPENRKKIEEYTEKLRDFMGDSELME